MVYVFDNSKMDVQWLFKACSMIVPFGSMITKYFSTNHLWVASRFELIKMIDETHLSHLPTRKNWHEEIIIWHWLCYDIFYCDKLTNFLVLWYSNWHKHGSELQQNFLSLVCPYSSNDYSVFGTYDSSSCYKFSHNQKGNHFSQEDRFESTVMRLPELKWLWCDVFSIAILWRVKSGKKVL